MATIFVSDLFNEAADAGLAVHEPDVGGTWVQNAGYTGSATVDAGIDRVRGSSSSNSAVYVNNEAPPSADYGIQAVLTQTTASRRVGLAIRHDSATTNGYLVYKDGSTWTLIKTLSGTVYTLGTFELAVTTGTDFTVLITATDTALEVFVNGTSRLAYNDTLNPISDANFGGLLVREGATVDSFIATTLDPTPANLSQTLIEVGSDGDRVANLSQVLVEIADVQRVPANYSQALVEVCDSPRNPVNVSQVLVEVAYRGFGVLIILDIENFPLNDCRLISIPYRRDADGEDTRAKVTVQFKPFRDNGLLYGILTTSTTVGLGESGRFNALVEVTDGVLNLSNRVRWEPDPSDVEP